MVEAKYNVVLLTSTIAESFGGLTISMMNKANVFVDNAGWKTTIFTNDFNPNYDQVIEKHYQTGKLSRNVPVVNLNHFFKDNSSSSAEIVTYKEIRDKFATFTLKTERISESFNYGSDSVLDDKDTVVYKYLYYSNGNVAKEEQYDPLSKKLVSEKYYKETGGLYEMRSYGPENGTNKLKAVYIFNYDNEPVRKFKSLTALKHFFWNEYLDGSGAFFIAETRLNDSVLNEYDNAKVKKISMMHSVHIRPDTDIVRLGNRYALSHLNDFDGLVLLTEKQREDIVRRFGPRSNYFVIGHHIDAQEITEPKNPNRIVVLARLDEWKRLDDTINAFGMIHDQHPEAFLDIYGKGDYENELQRLIDSRGLTDYVFLKGYTTNPSKELQNAAFTVLTSKFEGFGLGVQESLANGTPVISYDINYGPSDMIEDDVSGYLVEDGDVYGISEKMNELLSDLYRQKQFSINALKIVDKYSAEMFVNKWEELFKKVSTWTFESETLFATATLESASASDDEIELKIKYSVNNFEEKTLEHVDQVRLSLAEKGQPNYYYDHENGLILFSDQSTTGSGVITAKLKISDLIKFMHLSTPEIRLGVSAGKNYSEYPIGFGELQSVDIEYGATKILMLSEEGYIKFEMNSFIPMPEFNMAE